MIFRVYWICDHWIFDQKTPEKICFNGLHDYEKMNRDKDNKKYEP